MNANAVRRRILLDLACHGPVLVLACSGLSLLLAAWAMELRNSPLLFAGISCTGAAAAAAASRLILRGPELADQARAALADEQRVEREGFLDRLHAQFIRENDSVAAQLLADLRAFADLCRDTDAADGLAPIPPDIAASVRAVVDECVRALERGHVAQRASAAASPPVRALLDQERRQIDQDVAESVKRLERVMEAAHRFQLSVGSMSELAVLNELLEQDLSVLATVAEGKEGGITDPTPREEATAKRILEGGAR